MRRSRLWLAAAIVLFAAAAWLMRDKPKIARHSAHRPEEFPRYLRQNERKRLQQRAVVMPLRPDAGPSELPRVRDRFLAALPPIDRGPNKTAMVFEADAIKSMPVGKMFLRCIKRDGDDERTRRDIGIGVDDVERLAVADDVMVMAGDFTRARWDALTDAAPERRGAHATMYVRPGAEAKTIARYDDRFLIVGSRASVEAAIDRMDGDEPGRPAIPDGESYGEVYGTLSVDKLAQLIGRGQPDLADRLRQAAQQVSLHVDATGDVLLVADVIGPDGQQVSDLGKTMGGALSIGRLQAKASNDERLAELLETARVRPRDDSFTVEVALPLPLIERELGPCAEGWADAGK